MSHETGQVRILVLAKMSVQGKLHRQISSFGMVPVIVGSAKQLAPHIRDGEQYEVVLLPASLPNAEDWWAIWGEVAMLSPKPAILVYAQSATFQLWAGVLDAGGFDVIVEPLTDDKLREALVNAAKAYGGLPIECTETD